MGKRKYRAAFEMAIAGDVPGAERLYLRVAQHGSSTALKALAENDLGVLAAVSGDLTTARRHFERSVKLDRGCRVARQNLSRLGGENQSSAVMPEAGAPAVGTGSTDSARRIRVAILSFLFNWPSTGGGIIHTLELARFLELAGFEVRLLFPKYAPWGIGRMDPGCPFPGEALPFDDSSWNIESIKGRFRASVDEFAPGAVLITDCWNFKPHLADAMHGYPYFLRMQAQECLCPLNNLRLLPEPGGFRQCPKNQLSTPRDCCVCLHERGHLSGGLHQAERALSQVGASDYDALLRQSLRRAQGVLVLNRATAELYRPYANQVRVVTWGMDPARFPCPSPPRASQAEPGRPIRLFFAGLVEEGIKGFSVLHKACRMLWQRRQDFELVATAEPAGRPDEFTRYVGWVSQGELPAHYAAADITLVPTVAQEGLSRTAVEGMAAGRAVIGSRIGGLVDTLEEGINGLLAEPGSAEDLAAKIDFLLDRPQLREHMGLAGRARFEERYRWEDVIEREYRPLLQECCRSSVAGAM
jgi:glycosyltransferase involved in cell wall biosynthesis